MIKCENLRKNYLTKKAVDNITLEILKGKIYAILGPNGSGKTTFMKMAAGIVKPTSGTITYNGKEIGVYSKSKVAYMSTEPYFYKFMTAKHVGDYYRDFFEDFDYKRYESLLDRMELNISDKATSLSSGMAAKLKIAATLARNAETYMLDEPLNGIDIIARDKIITTILEQSRPENTLIISSHLVDELEKIIDSVIFIKNGSLVSIGDAEEIRESSGKSIVEIYKEIYA